MCHQTQGLGERRVSATLDDLPDALLLTIVSKVPFLVNRVRLAIVSKRFATLLYEPAFWSCLEFQGVSASISDDVLLSLARRANGQLRTLNTTHSACASLTLDQIGAPVLRSMAAEGLLAGLESLNLGRRVTLRSTANAVGNNDAQLLAAACPRLTNVDVAVDGDDWTHAIAAARLLPLSSSQATLNLGFGPTSSANVADSAFVAFSTATAGILSSNCRAIQWVHLYHKLDSSVPNLAELLGRSTEPADATRDAAEALSAALVHAHNGPLGLHSTGAALCQTPVFAHVCRALSEGATRRLTTLYLEHEALDANAATLLAAAVSSPRSSLLKLYLSRTSMSSEDGCAAASVSRTVLEVSSSCGHHVCNDFSALIRSALQISSLCPSSSLPLVCSPSGISVPA